MKTADEISAVAAAISFLALVASIVSYCITKREARKAEEKAMSEARKAEEKAISEARKAEEKAIIAAAKALKRQQMTVHRTINELREHTNSMRFLQTLDVAGTFATIGLRHDDRVAVQSKVEVSSSAGIARPD
jgi:hypothetical protein